jgi:hypothetical protein
MKARRYLVIIACALVFPKPAQATIYNFDTGTASEWSVTAGGAVNVQPYIYNVPDPNQYVGNVITVTSTANGNGTFLPGGSIANYDGYWTAVYSFSLPANVADIVLNYSKFFADDRAVLMLNGNIIDSTGLPTGGSSVGSMVLTDGSPAIPYTFDSPDGQVSGTVASGFNVGGLNTIEVILNDTVLNGTGGGVAGTMQGHLTSNDGTGMGLTGTISFTVVPEPSVGAFGLLTALGFAFVARTKSGSGTVLKRHNGPTVQ